MNPQAMAASRLPDTRSIYSVAIRSQTDQWPPESTRSPPPARRSLASLGTMAWIRDRQKRLNLEAVQAQLGYELLREAPAQY